MNFIILYRCGGEGHTSLQPGNSSSRYSFHSISHIPIMAVSSSLAVASSFTDDDFCDAVILLIKFLERYFAWCVFDLLVVPFGFSFCYGSRVYRYLYWLVRGAYWQPTCVKTNARGGRRCFKCGGEL